MIGNSGRDWGPSSPSNPQDHLRNRVILAAEAALSDHSYVSAIDVLCGMGLLAGSHVQAWRKGRIDFLERVIQGNLHKISSSMAIFRRWALGKGLKPSETRYVRRTRTGIADLRFSKSGDPEIEIGYRRSSTKLHKLWFSRFFKILDVRNVARSLSAIPSS